MECSLCVHGDFLCDISGVLTRRFCHHLSAFCLVGSPALQTVSCNKIRTGDVVGPTLLCPSWSPVPIQAAALDPLYLCAQCRLSRVTMRTGICLASGSGIGGLLAGCSHGLLWLCSILSSPVAPVVPGHILFQESIFCFLLLWFSLYDSAATICFLPVQEEADFPL